MVNIQPRITQMSTNEEKILYKDLSYKITELAMEVHSKLGCGFWEFKKQWACTWQSFLISEKKDSNTRD